MHGPLCGVADAFVALHVKSSDPEGRGSKTNVDSTGPVKAPFFTLSHAWRPKLQPPGK
jgi:hypothetical protein